jgi:hypothetical protein
MSCFADYLGLSGNYAAARLPQQQIAEARTQSLSAEHPDTLSARANLAYRTGLAGDAAAARPMRCLGADLRAGGRYPAR